MSDLEDLTRAYAVGDAALELGAVVLEGTAHPSGRVRLPMSSLNRHGLIAGATGTGKTKTLQLMAEQLSAAGVPVLCSDVKGDLSGLAAPGVVSDRVTQRAADTGTDWAPRAAPVELFSLGGLGTGIPLRATVTSFGPVLLSKVLGLNETQESSLGLVFRAADEAGLLLLDLKDLRAVIAHLLTDEGEGLLAALGGLSKATAGVLLRELLELEDAGGDAFFGEPEFDSADLLRLDPEGCGVVSVIGLQQVQDRPALFSTFLVWLLADLFQDLPEVGDADKPKLVFFLDEAHLLFDDASEAFRDAVARTVRLIRSKGVGVFFVTQSPRDLPSEVLGQLGNRVQHALRAFTPEDAAALTAAVRTYPRSDVYDVEQLLTTLGTGEAAVTVLSETGAPTPVAWCRMRPPATLMAPAPPELQAALVSGSPLQAAYGVAVDRESAYERLQARLAPPPSDPAPEAAPPPARAEEREAPRDDDEPGAVAKVLGSSAFRSLARSVASSAGREITRSLFGTARRRRR